jgi:hypothetical protein
MLFDLAHSMPMKHPVAPQSMRAWLYHLTVISVDSISMSMARDIDPGLAATTYFPGNQYSQAGRQLHQVGLGGWEIVCTTFTLSISHTAVRATLTVLVNSSHSRSS